MKKLFALFTLTAFLLIANVNTAHAQYQPMKTYVLITHTYDSNGWYFALDTPLTGKAPVMVQLYDSTLLAWGTPTVICDSVSRRTFSNTTDEGWFTALVQYQKLAANPFGIMNCLANFYYRWQGTTSTKLYYPSHYNKIRFYYR